MKTRRKSARKISLQINGRGEVSQEISNLKQVEIDATGGASGSGGPSGKRNGQYRHGERTKAAIAEQRRFGALLKMLRTGLT
jgi:hypothetical protein